MAEIRLNQDGKYEVWYRSELISVQNSMLKASHKLYKYIKSQQ
jgi:hypothetical protein